MQALQEFSTLLAALMLPSWVKTILGGYASSRLIDTQEKIIVVIYLLVRYGTRLRAVASAVDAAHDVATHIRHYMCGGGERGAERGCRLAHRVHRDEEGDVVENSNEEAQQGKLKAGE